MILIEETISTLRSRGSVNPRGVQRQSDLLAREGTR